MALDTSNIKIEPGNYSWANPETTRVACRADSSGDLGGTYITLMSSDLTVYHAWFDVDNTDVDPAPAGSTAIEVDISADDTAATVAAALAAAVEAVAKFNSKVDWCDNSKVIIENVGFQAEGDAVSAVADGAAATSFTITQLKASSFLALGFIDGDTEFSPSEDLVDVTAQQLGSQVVDQIRSGMTVDALSLPMKESDAAKLKAILAAGGETYTPSGGSEGTGWGDSKRFQNTGADSRFLLIHPYRLDASDRTADICLWRAYPNLSSLNFSGESEQMITVEFNFYPDLLKDQRSNFFWYGDWQDNQLR